MANFATHIGVGIIASGALATLSLAADLASPAEVVMLVFAGAAGAVLPDIDLENSRASQAMFSGLGILIAFAVMLNLSTRYSLVELWLIWTATFLGVRFVGHNVFHRLTRHRGVFHSLLAGLFFTCATAIFYAYGLRTSTELAWLAGIFVLIGYLTHLVLDEVYSVDVLNERIKASFGSALKLADFERPVASVAMLVALGAAFWLAPATDAFLAATTSGEIWASLGHRLVPADANWFGVTADLKQILAGWLAKING